MDPVYVSINWALMFLFGRDGETRPHALTPAKFGSETRTRRSENSCLLLFAI